jgi:hypothetical protein
VGRRSRKRGSTRADRDAARAERARAQPDGRRTRPGRRARGERPRPPWGSFPLSELVVLVGILLIAWGLVSGSGGDRALAAGLVLASLGGGELALREHLAGYRSHTTLLAGAATFAAVTAIVLGVGAVELWLLGLVGVAVFGGSFYAFRELFKRRSGGLGFR